MTCSCDNHCPDRATMRKRHGEPSKFAVSVYNAVPSFISVGEAEASIARYESEYAAAPEKASEPTRAPTTDTRSQPTSEVTSWQRIRTARSGRSRPPHR